MLHSSHIVVNLLLNLTLVFLEISQALLHVLIFFLLSGKCYIIAIAGKLKFGYDVGHIILVNGLEHVSHLFNLPAIIFGQLSVVFEFIVGIKDLLLQEIC